MSINPTPSRTFGVGAPAGLCVTTDRLRAGADLLGLDFQVDRHGISLDGVRFATLALADGFISEIAEVRHLGAWLDAVQLGVEEAATNARRHSMVTPAKSFTPKNILPEALRF